MKANKMSSANSYYKDLKKKVELHVFSDWAINNILYQLIDLFDVTTSDGLTPTLKDS